ncbi:MAG TPA: hypothetical protein ENO23_04825, partial [Alphaproteobacteria bacterium]|nr:hypothetical protein [Alphaproteobacteria bacterium]
MNARPGLYREAGQQPGTMPGAAAETAELCGFAERVRLLYSGIGLVAAVTLVNGLVLAILQGDLVGWPVAAGWYGLLAASIAWRASVVAMFRRADPPPAEMPRWARRYVVGAGFTGIAWGVAGIFLLPEDSPTHQVFTAFVLAGMSAGAMS